MVVQRTTREFLAVGLRTAKERKGLGLLLYAVDAVISLIVTFPIYGAIKSALGNSGFSSQLAGEFNLPVLSDIWNELFKPEADGGAAGGLAIAGALLLISVPILFLWKTTASVGVINAVRDGGIRGFWSGVGRYTGKAVLLAIPFVLLSITAVAGVLFVVGLLTAASGTERVVVWLVYAFVPIALIVLLSILDLMHDYARISIVSRETKVLTAFGLGIGWPFKYRKSILIYFGWFVIGALLLLSPLVFDSLVVAGTWMSLVVLTVCQQIALFLRATATVGWLASEVEYFEAAKFHEEPLYADDTPLPTPESENLTR